MISKNMGYAPGLALGRRWINKVNTKRLRGSLLHENLHLIHATVAQHGETHARADNYAKETPA